MKRPAEILNDDEVTVLIRLCSKSAPTGVRNRAMIAVMWRCGLRIAECLNLAVRDIDLDKSTVRVRHGKGDKSRTLGMDDLTTSMVAHWLTQRPKGSSTLFCTLKGEQMDQSYVRHLLRRLQSKAGVERRVHPHALRHSYAAGLAREQVPINVIRDALGHTNIATTDRYLRDISPEQVIQTMKAREWEL